MKHDIYKYRIVYINTYILILDDVWNLPNMKRPPRNNAVQILYRTNEQLRVHAIIPSREEVSAHIVYTQKGAAFLQPIRAAYMALPLPLVHEADSASLQLLIRAACTVLQAPWSPFPASVFAHMGVSRHVLATWEQRRQQHPGCAFCAVSTAKFR